MNKSSKILKLDYLINDQIISKPDTNTNSRLHYQTYPDVHAYYVFQREFSHMNI